MVGGLFKVSGTPTLDSCKWGESLMQCSTRCVKVTKWLSSQPCYIEKRVLNYENVRVKIIMEP